MKFTHQFVLSLIALAKLVMADSQQFGIISIASGSDLQYASAFFDSNNLVVGHQPNNQFALVVTDDGKLKSTSGSQRQQLCVSWVLNQEWPLAVLEL